MLGNTVIFDFDGTIVDSAPAILDTLEQVLAKHQLKPRRPVSHDLIGPPLPATLPALTGISDKAKLEQLIGSFKAVYDSTGLESTLLYAGMETLLPALVKSGYRLMLATNKRKFPTERLLAKFKLAECFTGVYCLDSQDPPYADKSRMLTAMLQTQSLTPRHSIYVGDTCHDEVAAARAGLPFLAVAWGYGVGVQLVSAQAQIVSTPSALLAAIAKHFSG